MRLKSCLKLLFRSSNLNLKKRVKMNVESLLENSFRDFRDFKVKRLTQNRRIRDHTFHRGKLVVFLRPRSHTKRCMSSRVHSHSSGRCPRVLAKGRRVGCTEGGGGAVDRRGVARGSSECCMGVHETNNARNGRHTEEGVACGWMKYEGQ